MIRLKSAVLAFAAGCLFWAAPALALDIECPANQVTTEITTPLPGAWWQTPQRGSLQNTRVGNVGGNPTLICEYWAYGTTVSVMRPTPDSHPDCTAHEGGFTCTRERPGRGDRGDRGGRDDRDDSATTYRTGPLSIPQTWRADFDTGQVGEGEADIWFHAVTARERYVEPMNGARLGIYSGGPGSSGISRDDCRSARKTTDRIPVSELSVGTYVCMRTSDGRIGVFRVNEPIGRSPGTLEIGFTVWN